MKKRKVLYISGTRADYGLMRQVLLAIGKHPKLSLEVAVTGMHLMPKFGETINEIKKDNLRVHIIKAVYQQDNKEGTAKFLGNFVLNLTEKIKKIKPDIILLLGDRVEMLGAGIVGVCLAIPVAHIHGGEVTATVDEIVRHAITKLSHIHFAANKDAAKRILNLGEDRWRIFVTGAPGLDSILSKKILNSRDRMIKKYQLYLSKPILLVIQHSVSDAVFNSAKQMRATMEVLKELACQAVVIYPNADPGGRKMIEVIEKYRKYPFIHIHKNLRREDFLALMKIAAVMVGNSSSGIIEAPALHLPVVNIGKRQEKRLRAGNLIEVGYQRGQIKKAIQKAIYNKQFREKMKKCRSPYGEGKASFKIAHILSKIEINKRLLNKRIAY